MSFYYFYVLALLMIAAPVAFAEGCLSIPGYAATVSRALKWR